MNLLALLKNLRNAEKKNKQLSHIISELDAKLQDAKRTEEDLNL